MIFRVTLGLFFVGAGVICAQLSDFAEQQLSPKENAVEEILSVRDSREALDVAISNAEDLGVSAQVLLEARFLFHVDRAEDAEIANLLPVFREQKAKFKLSESEIFGSIDDWMAVTEYVEALAALEEGDKSGFKDHIKEAFWLSPRQGAAFAPHIDRIRLMDAMKSIRVDFSKKYQNTISGEQVSLREIMGGNRALLLHFWSPWSRECEATLLDFMTTADHLISKEVAVVSILPETSKKVISDAIAMLESVKEPAPGFWLVDSKKSSLANQLKVQSVPAMVLLGPEGEVMFNGHPTDEDFWKALEIMNSEIERPEARAGQ